MLSKTAVEDRSLTKSSPTLPKRTSTYALRHGTLSVQTVRLGPYGRLGRFWWQTPHNHYAFARR